ncbi:tautomerase family protein [Chelativorans xinjiangense]|uniref:tautomerase family protein n=1 Tax=Chelativorans xinjiangense TaxID=2681485 RepID=UPI00135C0E3F|nr:hypothetical protein [Chelativorans xinjiangense]
MPFFEIFDFAASTKQRRHAATAMTDALCAAYGIGPEIVSSYFVDVGGDSYGHDRKFGLETSERRIFIKVHAFRRSAALRREAALSVTRAAAEAYETNEKSIVVYFFDREPDEVAHGGTLGGG